MIARIERITRPVPLILILFTFNGAFALLLEGDLGWGQATLVVASAILQIAVDVVFRFGKADLLDEGGLIFEVLQLHVEYLVHLRDDLALRGELAHQFDAVHLHHVETGLDRPVIAQIRGIDVPAFINRGMEDNLTHCTVARFQFRGKMHRIHHLGIDHQCQDQCPQQYHTFLHNLSGGAMLVEFFEEIIEGFQANEDEEGRCGSEDVQTSSAGQTDGGCDPEASGSGQTAHHILALVEDDGSCTDETDTGHYLSSYTRHIPAVFRRSDGPFEAIGRDNHKQGRA